MIGYALAILPLYIFVYIPVSQLLGLPSLSPSSSSRSHDYEHEHTFNASFIAPEDPDLICPEHTYTTSILSREPLVLYLEGWLSEEEIAHLLEISEPHFQTSHVSTGPAQFVDPSIRLSDVATLPRSPTVKCIEARARALQGWSSSSSSSRSLYSGAHAESQSPNNNAQEGGDPTAATEGLLLERLKIQRYGPGGHYAHHYDWHGAGRADRVSSFMVYVDANCTGGGTGFPRLRRPPSSRWCRFVECAGDGDRDDPTIAAAAAADAGGGEGAGWGGGWEWGWGRQRPGEGVVFKPLRGNAVYWENLRADGSGYVETWHAGLPVETGVKIGLNIWSWYRF